MLSVPLIDENPPPLSPRSRQIFDQTARPIPPPNPRVTHCIGNAQNAAGLAGVVGGGTLFAAYGIASAGWGLGPAAFYGAIVGVGTATGLAAAAVAGPLLSAGYALHRYRQRHPYGTDLNVHMRNIFTAVNPRLITRIPETLQAACGVIYTYSTNAFRTLPPMHRELYVYYALFCHDLITFDLVAEKISAVFPPNFPYQTFWETCRTLTACSDDDYRRGEYFFLLSDTGRIVYVVTKNYFKKFVLRIFVADAAIGIDSFFKYSPEGFAAHPNIRETLEECSILRMAYLYTANQTPVLIDQLFAAAPDLRDQIKNAVANSHCPRAEEKLIDPDDMLRLGGIIDSYIQPDPQPLGFSLTPAIEELVFTLFHFSAQPVPEKAILLHSLALLFSGLSSVRFLGTVEASTVPLRRLAIACLNSMRRIDAGMYALAGLDPIRNYLGQDTCAASVNDLMFLALVPSPRTLPIVHAVVPPPWWSGDVLNFH